MRLVACQLSEANNTKHVDLQEVTDILVSSSTQRQYQTYINKWFEFPAGRDCDPFTPDVAIILEFMANITMKVLVIAQSTLLDQPCLHLLQLKDIQLEV